MPAKNAVNTAAPTMNGTKGMDRSNFRTSPLDLGSHYLLVTMARDALTAAEISSILNTIALLADGVGNRAVNARIVFMVLPGDQP